MTDTTDSLWTRPEIESPCVRLCAVHPVERICVGCFRTIEEIGRWGSMSPQTRRRIMDELPGRAPRLQRRRGGHAGRVGTG
ncbi:DUF1289 domain-containing protein [Pontitalea aquivivens]|uniref:DUF1289 domain-containing protein n=1 Tax=Pontitalea aquivivens TaxID=3388663 RepID=UPI0039706521